MGIILSRLKTSSKQIPKFFGVIVMLYLYGKVFTYFNWRKKAKKILEEGLKVKRARDSNFFEFQKVS